MNAPKIAFLTISSIVKHPGYQANPLTGHSVDGEWITWISVSRHTPKQQGVKRKLLVTAVEKRFVTRIHKGV